MADDGGAAGKGSAQLTSDEAASAPEVPSLSGGKKGGGGARRQPQRGSKTIRVPGEREMKEYPVSRDELIGLGAASALSSAALSYGLTQLNRSYDISKDLELTQGLPPQLIGRWQAKQEEAYFWGVCLLVVGAAIFLLGGAKVFSILRSTSHEEG